MASVVCSGAAGLVASAAELQASLRPTDYVYGQPTAAQLAAMRRALQQQSDCSPLAPSTAQNPAVTVPTVVTRAQAALQGAAPEVAAKPSSTLAASVDDLFNNHLALDLDDDCLRLLLGEDADESAPCVSAGSGKAGSGASEKSSGTAAGEADAASHEDDDIAMLFGEMRHTVGPSLEPLELHLLGTAHLHATDDADTSSEAGGHAGDNEGLATEHSGGTPTKRARQGADHESSPSGRGGLMLSMNYEKAAESINLELLASGRKACVPLFSDGTEAMLPSMLLSPLLGFADIDSPDSPHSLASGCDAMEPLSGLDLQRLDSTSKRKRAVCL